ncbi:CIC11C00000005064 [Sungouiella intermedia]|uniref:PRA1 family protein n=2 Tax=Sungouiella intermedia TaxID=45354 RepID=A0A1L0BHK5_9ASCO|nr:CIC11C00000005064 [[Candida] intermedia]
MSLSLSSIPFSQFTDRFSMERIRNDVSSLQSTISKIRPPQEFFDFRRLSKPANFGEIQSRVGYNLGYFQGNYIAVVSLLSVYALVTNLLLLFVILVVAGGVFGISKLDGQDLVLPVGRFNTSQLYTGLLIVAVPLGFLASPISTMMWLIGSSAVSVLSHASFMEKPIETVFEEEV